jgi:hypothetical protein
MNRSILLSAAAIALMAGSVSAQAACGPSGTKAAVIRNLPQIKLPASVNSPASYGSIVGLWHVRFIVGGTTVLHTISTWHSDGTEFDNADIPPIMGNTCEGVWESTGAATVQLHHIGWTFDSSSNPSGSFVLEETLKLGSAALKYKGTFDQKFYDTNGNLVQELSGNIAADRVTVD